jgi:hypothetical protein
LHLTGAAMPFREVAGDVANHAAFGERHETGPRHQRKLRVVLAFEVSRHAWICRMYRGVGHPALRHAGNIADDRGPADYGCTH